VFVSRGLQLTLDAADRLVEALTRSQEPIAVGEAVRLLLRADRVPVALGRRLIEDVVSGDARLVWRSAEAVALGAWLPRPQRIEDARFCVVDLETTGMRPTADRIVEIGAVIVEGYELGDTYERLVDPGVPIPAAITRITGIGDGDLAGRSRIRPALDGFVRFAGAAVLVAHNARFDVGFLDAEISRARSRRLACTVIDTVGLARRLLPGRRRYSLAALAERYATAATPCHRALPDALATAELLLVLIGKAQEGGAETVDDLVALSAPAARRAHAKRALAEGAPRRPGTYVMRDGHDRALYVGTAANLRTRTLAYFRGGSQPRAVERVLPAVERLEFREAGSAFEARLDEIRLIAGLRPTANRRGARPERQRYLRLERDGIARLTATDGPGLDAAVVAGPVGPARATEQVLDALRRAYGLRTCRAAAPVEPGCLEGRLGRCLAPCRGAAERAAHAAAADGLAAALEGGGGVPVERLRERRRALAASLRFEEAARLRDGEEALRAAGRTLRAIREARVAAGVILAAHADPRLVQAFAVAYGLELERRAVPRAGSGRLETSALAAAVERALAAGPGIEGRAAVPGERRDEALLLAAVLERPPVGVAAVAWMGDRGAFLDAVTVARARVTAPAGGST
jgi:DNA polymerase-3 subunit epsilon